MVQSLSFTRQLLDDARTDVAHADQKASILLATVGIGFSALFGSQLVDPSGLGVLGLWIYGISLAFAAASVVACSVALWPRYQTGDLPNGTVAYWANATEYESPADLGKALSLQSFDEESRSTYQLWHLSKLLLLKFRAVRASMVLGGLAAVLLLVSFLIG